MPEASTTVGHVQVIALLDGRADLRTPMVEAFPDAPADALLAERDRFPDVYGSGDVWRLAIWAWLVRHPGGLLLMDTGVGPASAPAFGWFRQPGALHEGLAEAGVGAHHIDTVVLSHVHDDHVGGTVTAEGAPAFPNARYVLQQADLDAQRALARESEEEARVWEELVVPLRDGGVLDTVEGDVALTDLLELRHAPGHTPGHQVLRVASQGRRLLLSADTWNHPAQLGRPDWPSGTDTWPARAARSRRAMLADVLSHPGMVIAPGHFAEPFGRVVSRGGLATWDPLP
jgi:glyoxylase-like metal-dependent hydrolase (beta-lactamase superfamily II)